MVFPIDYDYTIKKKRLLELRRNSGMEVAARIICNLLLKAQNMLENMYVFFVDFLAHFRKY